MFKGFFKKEKNTQSSIDIDKLVEHKFIKGCHHSNKPFVKKWNTNQLKYKVYFTKRSLYNPTEGDWNKLMYFALPKIIPNHTKDGFCVGWRGDTYKDENLVELTGYFHNKSKKWNKVVDTVTVPLFTEITITQTLGNKTFDWQIEFDDKVFSWSHPRKNKKKVNWIFSSYITSPYFGGSVPPEKLTTLKISDINTILY